MRVTHRILPSRVAALGVSTALLLAVAPVVSAAGFAPQRGPEELHGEVTAVAGDRIHITISEEGWLPRAGTKVDIGTEMAGMWVPLKGNFVIVQVNADSCVAQHVGDEEHGDAAAGMRAVMKTPFPNHPQSRSDYLGNPDMMAAVLSMAEGGDRMAQHTAAMSFEGRGDFDNALTWWERSSNGATERLLIAQSATGRAKILAIRGELQQAMAILQDAASRTQPRADELVFGAYSSFAGADPAMAVSAHVDVLKELGSFNRVHLENIAESQRWYRAATEVMGAAASNGAPGPDEPTHTAYLMLLSELAGIHMRALEDNEGAVPWLQIAARAGDTSAQETLTRLGYTW